MLSVGDLRRAMADMPADAAVLLRADMAVPLSDRITKWVLEEPDGPHEAYIDGWYDIAQTNRLSDSEFVMVLGDEI